MAIPNSFELSLSKTKELSREFDEIILKEKKRVEENKSSFNVLACLTKHHREELHTRFIRYLLNPKEAHACGSDFISNFFKILREDNQLMKLKLLPEISEEDLRNAKVEFKDKYSEEFGRMDIFIETKTAIVVIENKIGAGEQSNQIFRYASYCEERQKKEGKSFIVLYLTLNGTDSKQSGDKNYFSISYYTHIRNWIKKCMHSFSDCESVLVGMKSYLEILGKNILNLSTTNITMDIKDLLLKEENKIVIKHLHKLSHALVPVRNELRSQFFKRVQASLNEKGFDFVPINHITGTIDSNCIWDEMYRGFKLNDKKYQYETKSGKKIIFCIEHDWADLYYGLVVLEDNPINVDFTMDPELKTIYERLNEEANLQLTDRENCWLAYKHSSIYDTGKFGDDSLNYQFSTEMDTLVESFVSEVEKYLIAYQKVVLNS